MDFNAAFYDIESLGNVFTLAVYYPAECGDRATERPGGVNTDQIDIYILDDGLLNWVPNPDVPGCTKLPDDDGIELYKRILEANPTTTRAGFTGVTLRNLRDEKCAKMLARQFGPVVEDVDFTHENDPNRFSFTADTDPDYDERKHPFLVGYNSFNYDTTMLALLIMELFHGGGFDPAVTARTMRDHNDNLFTPEYKGAMTGYLTRVTRTVRDRGGNVIEETVPNKRDWNRPENLIRQSMMRSGRHIDAGRLNEKQVKVALKRLLGLIGAQILESEALDSSQVDIADFDQFADLVAYNVSDVVNLKELFLDRSYSGQFATKRNMLESYPELVYEYAKPRKVGADGRIEVDRANVRRNRLYADSSSQQLSSRTLCPEGHLTDKPVISFEYPGIPDVLDFARDFYMSRVMPLVPKGTPWHREALEQFQRVYDMYASLRGRNCDNSQYQAERYPELFGPDSADMSVDPHAIGAKCAVYVGADGMPTSCYVSFSTGGIHGAEYNKALYDADMSAYLAEEHLRNQLRAAGFDTSTPAGATALRNSVPKLKEPVPVDFDDGVPRYCSDFLKSGSTKASAHWKPNPRPQLFKTNSKRGTMTLNKRYVFTSAAQSNHEDFTSYYPGLLRQMRAFDNPMLGYDRYGEIFEGKERYGRIMKDASLPQSERDFARAQRENVKLILNSASGGGDAGFDTPIRMNNNIVAMRCIGQLFTWYIGQAQAIEGARIPSTNTDGLYTVLEQGLNDEILARESAVIDVPIEPEPLWLISKDSNNRIEFGVSDDGEIDVYSASGDLACWRGPSTSKSLDHPAVVDYALVRYMTRIVADGGQDALYEPFDRALAMTFLEEVAAESDIEHCLMMFQNILASSPSSCKYVFATDIGVESPRVSEGTAHPLQHYNRVFMMKEGFEGAMNVMAASGTIVTPAVKRTRKRAGMLEFDRSNKLAIEVLVANGACRMPKRIGHDAIPELEAENREATIRKIPNIPPDVPVLVDNHAIRGMDPARAREIVDGLDLELYLDMVQSAYEDNWRNVRA